jgi:hypothetical protein
LTGRFCFENAADHSNFPSRHKHKKTSRPKLAGLLLNKRKTQLRHFVFAENANRAHTKRQEQQGTRHDGAGFGHHAQNRLGIVLICVSQG